MKSRLALAAGLAALLSTTSLSFAGDLTTSMVGQDPSAGEVVTTDVRKSDKTERKAEKTDRKADKSAAKAEKTAAKADRPDMTDEDETDTSRMGQGRRTGITAGTMTGNPGYNENVGRAGESPNGRDFGGGTRGRSDAGRNGSDGTDTTGSTGGNGGGDNGGNRGGGSNRGGDNGGNRGGDSSGGGNRGDSGSSH